RKIIGNGFWYVCDYEATKLAGEECVSFLTQGTLYTDVIESGTGTAQTIKSPHNVGGLPEDMQLVLIGPLYTLFKNEVRAIGTELGMRDAIVWRQRYPGAGLGTRVLGDITEDKLQIGRDSDAMLREDIAAAGLDRDIRQYVPDLDGICSVG
ncbi:GMP synthase (glutamine-hydrolyzing), partial [Enterococcus faecalis]|nr:GMP synthase (glutamine-hydrolyzing) [Enterococcus faecalis]